MQKSYIVYIMTNKIHSVLYTGFTNDIERRVMEHKSGKYINAFTKKYNTTKLIYFEIYSTVHSAKHREFLLKKWKRVWKVKLINSKNPTWRDLSGHKGEIEEGTFRLFLAD